MDDESAGEASPHASEDQLRHWISPTEQGTRINNAAIEASNIHAPFSLLVGRMLDKLAWGDDKYPTVVLRTMERANITLWHLNDMIINATEIGVQLQDEVQAFSSATRAFLDYFNNDYLKMKLPLERFFRARKIRAQFERHMQAIEEHRTALDLLLGLETRADVPELRRQTSQMLDDILAPGDREIQASSRVVELGGYEAVGQDPQAMQEIGAILGDDTPDLWSGIIPVVDRAHLRNVEDTFEHKQLTLLPDTVVTNFTFHGEQPKIRHSSLTPIAFGATASVYSAKIYTATHSAIVALKVHPKHDTRFHGQLLAREVKLWATLRHKHILPFYGSCDFGEDKIALISPFMENGTMIKYLTEHPSVNRLVLIMQVLEGVRYLHEEARIVHGDLKCENVLIAANGSALVGDFGLSTTIEAYTDNSTATDIRNCHTFRFAAPELLFEGECPAGSHPSISLRPRRSKTVPSDVYALGMLIYQAYTLAPPWPRATFFEVMLRIAERVGPPRTTDGEGMPIVPDPVWPICSSMWAFSAADRPTLAAVLLQVRNLLSPL